MQFEPGLRITDSIELRQMVGEGGMGQIWSADHLLLKRPVAVKRLASRYTENIEAVQRFAAEAQVCARMECANVTRVFDYAVLPDGTPVMVMELLEGAELYARIRDGHRLPIDETQLLVEQMCAALTSIHEAGIVHRDVKPENIFLVPSKKGGFVAKLIDFGIAKGAGATDCDELANAGLSVLGTPAYMSPEQLENPGEVDARADLWSLAVVIYCCLTGQMPFGGDSLSTVGLAIRRGEFSRPTELRPELPPAVDAWFDRALAHERDARFQSAAAMAQAFVAAVQKPAPQAPPPARPHLELVMTPPVPMRAFVSAPARPSGILRVLTAVATLAAAGVALNHWLPLPPDPAPISRTSVSP